MTDDHFHGPRPQQAENAAFLRDFAAMSVYGRTPAGGVDRQAASAADGEVRAWLADWLRTRGFTVRIDRIGNIFGRLEWTPGAPYVLAGSHLDSQPLGGKWDGAYGVLAAAHAADRMRRHVEETGEPPAYNLAVVDWFNEEGSRFKPSMMGSGVYTGVLDLDTALQTRDPHGATVAEALDALGQRGDEDVPHPRSYAEIHVEQGRLLEKDDVTIGLVDATWAARKLEVVVEGVQSHSGATEMADRHDALYGAALLVVEARELADRIDGELHTSCSELYVLPNSPVTVAREVRMHVDLRAPEPAVIEDAVARVRDAITTIEARANVRIDARVAHSWDPMAYQPEGVALADEVSRALGLSRRPIMTVAGHDSTNMKDIVPTVMLFVPSTDGIAHNEGEDTPAEDACAGVDLLTEVLARMCAGALDR